MTDLVVFETPISMDSEGRFRLNDLHKASGGEQRNRPNYWLENDKTKEFIEVVKSASGEFTGVESVVTVKGGAKQGTFVVKSLVYAYVMWLSPAFQLHVIEAFDKLVSDKITELEWVGVRTIVKQEFKI